MERFAQNSRPAIKFLSARKRLSQQIPYKESRTMEVPVSLGKFVLGHKNLTWLN